jgi:methionyl-tRNA formyltransferase
MTSDARPQPGSLRIVFFGTPAFAVPTLGALLATPHRIVAVVTQPDKPRGRGQRVSDAPVKALAIAHGLPLLQPQKLSREIFEADFTALHVDLGVVAAYGKILPEWLLEAPRLGLINVHASLLPKYRGAAPVHRAVMNGELETGVTIMRIVKALDAGPMLARAVRPIGPNDSSDEVERDLATLGADLLVRTLDPLAAGEVVEVAQDESRATYAPRLTKEEGLIDFTRSAADLHNQIRGLRPWPAAYTLLDGTRLVVHRARVSARRADGPPGTCSIADASGITVACGDGLAIDFLDVQPEGRRVMTAREYAAGHAHVAGRRFG